MENTNTNTKIKLTNEELSSIKSIRDDYQQKIFKFGELNIQRLEIENAITELKKSEDSLKQEYIDLQKKEQELINKLLTKYGEGSISMSTGEFILNS